MAQILLNNNIPEFFLKEITIKTKLVDNIDFSLFFYIFSSYHCITQARWLNSLINNNFDYDLAEEFFRDKYDDQIDSLELRLCFDEVESEIWELIFELHTESYLDFVMIESTVKNFIGDL